MDDSIRESPLEKFFSHLASKIHSFMYSIFYNFRIFFLKNKMIGSSQICVVDVTKYKILLTKFDILYAICLHEVTEYKILLTKFKNQYKV